VKTFSDFVPLLGAPIRQDERQPIREVASSWTVVLPADFVEIADACGDAAVSGYLYLCGARTLGEYSATMVVCWRSRPRCRTWCCRLPAARCCGGNTLEGDQLFLVPREDGVWTVSAFRRGWADWFDSDLCFGDWFHLALNGKTAADWLPEWGPLSHALETDD
jgi:hypothetical protein